ncbi:MAG: Ig-like domain-containing protein [Propionibacteriaceae bacterium]|nr:Ig-like domain-containing protein [Propionibacteriaceae bacterium]
MKTFHLWRHLIPVVIVVACVSVVVSLAVFVQGNAVQRPELNNSAIWVSNDADGWLGRFNKASSAMELTVSPSQTVTKSVDVLQDGNTVVGWDRSHGSLVSIDTAADAVEYEDALQLPAEAQVDVRGGTLAVLDVKSGSVWAMRTGGEPGFLEWNGLDEHNPALASVGGPAALSVSSDGTVVAASTSGMVVSISAQGTGFAEPVTSDLHAKLATVSVAAVGDKAVVVDSTTGTVYLPGGKTAQVCGTEAEGVCAVVQAGGMDTGSVAVATSTSLLTVRYDGTVSTWTSAVSGQPASPLVVSGCVYGAWAGNNGVVAESCGDAPASVHVMDASSSHAGTELVDPVFRVNFGQLVLNDRATGRVFDMSMNQSVDTWPAPDEMDKNKDQDQQNEKAAPKTAEPTAVDDEYSVRASRTSILHVLDNDSDPNGGILAVVSVDSQPSGGASAVVAPDGQTILYTQPAKGENSTFSYTISNVAGQTASAMVTITADGPNDNTVPNLRDGATPLTSVVASGGSVSIPVANQFRDQDCDPITVVSAQVGSGQGSATVTSNGLVKFLAPTTSTDVTVSVQYVVTDGFDPTGSGQFASVDGLVSVTVVGDQTTTGVAPVANPDQVSGVVGQPIQIHPLANDVPGVDPGNPGMTLTLAADVEFKSGLSSVVTDHEAGLVTVTASKAGTYLLGYTAAFGSAPTSASTIRVDVRDPADEGKEPIAVPDQAVVRGQSPVMVDVLANDSDPQGRLLTVQTATPADADALAVAIVQGRWVRIQPLEPVLTHNPTSVVYEVTNGDQVYVTGSITVTQLPALDVDTPLLSDDAATVRSGDSALIPVLGNDTSEGGSPLTLVTNIPGVTTGLGGTLGAGELPVADPAVAAGQNPTDVGSAYVAGSYVRYVAPPEVTTPRQVQITYYAQTATSTPVSATVTVTISPVPSPTNVDNSPAPALVEARAVAGDTITIPVPSWGQDPDGDSVQLVGLGSAPILGRVLSFTPDGISYQAYPSVDACGTDSFTYIVSDRYGETGVGSIHVAVTPPGPTQPPMGVADEVTAAPGTQVAVDVMANDILAAGDQVTIVDVSEPGTLADPQGPILVTAPADGETVTVTYELQGNSDQRGQASLRVTGKEGFVNPPVAGNIVADVAGGVATADVVAKASDPDSDPATLKVRVLNDPTATVAGGVVTIAQKPVPQILTYQLTDPEGGTSAALIYVPAANDGLPYAVGSITMDQDSSKRFSVEEYVKSMRSAPVQITSDARLTATPAQDVTITMTSATGFEVTSSNGYVGPAAVSMEVTDGVSVADPKGRTSVVSIPVQVGPATPVMYCPKAAQSVQVGTTGSVMDVTSLCHVWTPNPIDPRSLTYSVAWQTQPKDVSVVMTDDHRAIQLSAAGSAHAGDTGALTVTMEGKSAAPATINVVVRDAAKPKIDPISVTTQAGKPVTGTITLTSTLANGRQDTIVSITPMPGTANNAQVSGVGTPTWSVTPPAGFYGVLTYALVVSDVADTTATDRQVRTTLSVAVVDVPDAPSAPVVGANTNAGSVRVSWAAPNANGARIEKYILENDQGAQWTCATTTCVAQPVAPASTYRFHVRAVNSAGAGPWSPWSAQSQTTSVVPTPVTGFHATDPKDGAITLTWDAMTTSACGCSVSGLTYVISWPGGSKEGISGTLITLTGLTNEQTSFTIWAVNADGRSKVPATTQGWPSGAPKAFTVNPPTAVGGNASMATLSWTPAAANGEGPVRYWVSDNQTPIPSCQGITATQCSEDGIPFSGEVHHLQVIAKNKPEQYQTTSSLAWTAYGVPPQMSPITAVPTGVEKMIHVSGTALPSRGPASASYVEIWVDGTLVASLPVYDGPFTWTGASPTGNGTMASVTAKICYTSDGPQCGAPSRPATVTPFGPLKDLKVVATMQGASVWLEVTGNANGAPATMSLKGSNTGCDASMPVTGPFDYTCNMIVCATTLYVCTPGPPPSFTAVLESDPMTPSRTSLTATTTAVQVPVEDMTLDDIVIVSATNNTVVAQATGDAKGLTATLSLSGVVRTSQVNSSISCGQEQTATGTGKLTVTLTCQGDAIVEADFTATMTSTEPGVDRKSLKVTAQKMVDYPELSLGDITYTLTPGPTSVTATIHVTGNNNGNSGVGLELWIQGANPQPACTPSGGAYQKGIQGDTTLTLTCTFLYGKTYQVDSYISFYTAANEEKWKEGTIYVDTGPAPVPGQYQTSGVGPIASDVKFDYYYYTFAFRGFIPNSTVACGKDAFTVDGSGNGSGTSTSRDYALPTGQKPATSAWVTSGTAASLGPTCTQK